MGIDTKMIMVYQWNHNDDWSSYEIIKQIENALNAKYLNVSFTDNSKFHSQNCTFYFLGTLVLDI